MNLRKWNIQCSAKCVLRDSSRPTTAHVLGGYPVALFQDRCTYPHNFGWQFHQDLHWFAEFMLTFLTCEPVNHLHLRFHLMWLWFPLDQISLSIILSLPVYYYSNWYVHWTVLTTLNRPDIVNKKKAEYHQILSELDRLNVIKLYKTLKISVLGHYHQFSVTNTYNVLHFIDKDINITKSSVQKMLDYVSRVCLAGSQRIFMANDCREWLCPT